jgi:hypothetical protein
MITNDARCIREIKSRIVMTKAAFNRKKTLFTSKLDLNLRKKLVKCYIWSVRCWNLDTSDSRSEVPGNFWNVVLEKDGENELDWPCEKCWSITYSQGGEEHPACSKNTKYNWTGHILRSNCLIKRFIKGKIGGRTEVKERQGRTPRQLLDDLNETRGYWKLKEQALDRRVFKIRFGRDYGPVVK